jgi:hypothetical protein
MLSKEISKWDEMGSKNGTIMLSTVLSFARLDEFDTIVSC